MLEKLLNFTAVKTYEPCSKKVADRNVRLRATWVCHIPVLLSACSLKHFFLILHLLQLSDFVPSCCFSPRSVGYFLLVFFFFVYLVFFVWHQDPSRRWFHPDFHGSNFCSPTTEPKLFQNRYFRARCFLFVSFPHYFIPCCRSLLTCLSFFIISDCRFLFPSSSSLSASLPVFFCCFFLTYSLVLLILFLPLLFVFHSTFSICFSPFFFCSSSLPKRPHSPHHRAAGLHSEALCALWKVFPGVLQQKR